MNYSLDEATRLRNLAAGRVSFHSQSITEIVAAAVSVDTARQMAIAHQTPDARAHLSNKCVELAHVLGRDCR